MADVQIAIRLGRKARADFRGIDRAFCLVRRIAWASCPFFACVFILGQIAIDNAANKVGGGRYGCFF